MEKNLLIITCFVLAQSTIAQIIQRPPVTHVLNHNIIALNQNTVTLYKDVDFNGQSKALGIGSFALNNSDSMANTITSIKVPAGMVAIIYDNGDAGGGYGTSLDLMEDCPDLSVYNFNDKAVYITIFNAKNSAGLVWVRGKMVNAQYIAGHWERQRANGVDPNSSVAVVAPPIPPHGPDLNDLSLAPQASQAEIDEFNNVYNNQNGVGILGGSNARPFYYHANQTDEVIYQKLIDASRLPSGALQAISDYLSGVSVVGPALAIIPYTGKIVIEYVDEMKDWLLGSSSTPAWINAWYPVNENKITVCGIMDTDVTICSQDYLHTKLTVDKDVNFEINPDKNFTWSLNNRWLKPDEQKQTIEGEVKLKNLYGVNTINGSTHETIFPHNPLLIKILKNKNVCIYGPWMADILDIEAKVPIPLIDDNIDIKHDLNTNNEIHPVNQVWYKDNDDLQLIAIADGNGYFDKTGNTEIAASGLHLTRSFYIAFQIPKSNSRTTAINGTTSYEYDIDGIGFDFTNNQPQTIPQQTFSRKYNGVEVIKVHDNFLIKLQKTHELFFDKIRMRPDGSIQGYIIVETVPMDLPGGSINISVKKIINQQGGIINNVNTTKVAQ